MKKTNYLTKKLLLAVISLSYVWLVITCNKIFRSDDLGFCTMQLCYLEALGQEENFEKNGASI